MIWFTRIYGIHYDVATWTPHTKNPRELDVPIGEGILISLSILYQLFNQLLIAKDWTEPAWASTTYTLRRRNNWILRRDIVWMSTYRVPISTDLGSKLISLTILYEPFH